MIEIRRMTQRWAGRLTLLLIWYAGLAVLLVGADSALDWHRHTGAEGESVHLHPHVGDHHHDDGDHDHSGDETPGSTDSGRGPAGTLSLASGALAMPASSAPEIPSSDLHSATINPPSLDLSSRTAPRPGAPRAPPV